MTDKQKLELITRIVADAFEDAHYNEPMFMYGMMLAIDVVLRMEDKGR